MHSQVLLNTMHVQVCTLGRCIYAYMYVYIYIYAWTYICICMYTYTYICIYVWMYIYVYVYVCVYVYVHIYICVCICIYIYTYIYIYIACMCSLFHLALGTEDRGVQLVYESACCLAWGFIFDRRKDTAVVCVFSIFNAGGIICVCVCVYTHTHTRKKSHAIWIFPKTVPYIWKVTKMPSDNGWPPKILFLITDKNVLDAFLLTRSYPCQIWHYVAWRAGSIRTWTLLHLQNWSDVK